RWAFRWAGQFKVRLTVVHPWVELAPPIAGHNPFVLPLRAPPNRLDLARAVRVGADAARLHRDSASAVSGRAAWSAAARRQRSRIGAVVRRNVGGLASSP